MREVSVLSHRTGWPLSTLALAGVEEVEEEVVEEEEQAAVSLHASEATANHAVQDPGQSLARAHVSYYRLPVWFVD